VINYIYFAQRIEKLVVKIYNSAEEEFYLAIIRQLNKKTGITYVFESVSYRDPVTKQPCSKRKCIGKLDENTNEIVPTRKKKSTTHHNESGESSGDGSTIKMDIIKEKDSEIIELKRRINELEKREEKIRASLLEIVNLI
jgi:hypothetical protein